jgi:ClpX C4-type zinc finger
MAQGRPGSWTRGDIAQEMAVVERWAKLMGAADYRAALQVASERASSTPEGSTDPLDRIIEWLVWLSAVAVARTTENPTPAVCSFCGRDTDVVSKLVAGPGVSICDLCVAEAVTAFHGIEPRVAPSKDRCSFCKQKSRVVGALFARGTARICSACTGTSDELIKKDAGAA